MDETLVIHPNVCIVIQMCWHHRTLNHFGKILVVSSIQNKMYFTTLQLSTKMV